MLGLQLQCIIEMQTNTHATIVIIENPSKFYYQIWSLKNQMRQNLLIYLSSKWNATYTIWERNETWITSKDLSLLYVSHSTHNLTITGTVLTPNLQSYFDPSAGKDFWNIVTKEEIAHKQYLLLPQCFHFYSIKYTFIGLRDFQYFCVNAFKLSASDILYVGKG